LNNTSRWLVTCPENSKSVPVYLEWLRRAGIEGSVILDDFRRPENLERFDGLLLAGGPDVDPARYGDASVHPKTYGVDTRRDELEIALFNRFAGDGKPVFGICRGLQVMNVALGGGLFQHVPDNLCDGCEEEHNRGPAYDANHSLIVNTSTFLGPVLAGIGRVNSAHHQAIDPARLGRGLRIAALSGSGIVEAVELDGTGARVCAVQWHPERLPPEDPASLRLIRHLSTQDRRHPAASSGRLSPPT